MTEQVNARRQETLASDARANEAELRALTDALPVLVSIVDKEQRYRFANRAYEDWFGIPRQELIGRTLLEIVGAAAYAQLQPFVLRALSGERFSIEQHDVPYRFGGVRDIKVDFVPHLPEGGYFALIQDITAERRADEELERQSQQLAELARHLEATSRAKDEFLATASHELRTPLNAILGWARLLRAGQVEPSDYARGLEIIERNATAQVRLIEDILDGSRIITGKLRLEIRPIDLAEVVRAAIEAVRPAAEAKEIRLSMNLHPDAARIAGDPERLQQVVWNLANNAVKFTPRDGAVEVALERKAAHVELVVSDTGQGIASEFLPHVFERFRQAEGSTTRRHGGLGLGLALVRHLVEAHGGSVSAVSDGEGRRSRFKVMLPVQAAPQPRMDSERPRATAPPIKTPVPRARLAGVTALVVDDEPDTRELVAVVLRSSGAEVRTAANALEALEMLEVALPKVLVSDIGMPEVDGYELMRRVRRMADACGATLSALALTAYSREEDRRLALDAGFQIHVAKPVEPDELLRVVAELASTGDAVMSQRARDIVPQKAGAFSKFEKLLTTRGIQEGLRFLNSRTPHRFTGLYRFEPPFLRNIALLDSDDVTVTKGEDAPMRETYCSLVRVESSFSTDDARGDARLQTHPARDVVKSYCGVVLRDACGEPYGTLCHFDLVPCEASIAEIPLMEAAAPLLMQAIAKADDEAEQSMSVPAERQNPD